MVDVDAVGRKCSFCGQPAEYTDRIGSLRLYACGEHECGIQFDDEMKEASSDMDEYAREEAERDNYERYRF